jgi:hypothetical protein
MDGSIPLHDGDTRRLSRLAGLGYGLIYGLAYGLTVWGIDTRILARSSGELAWAKLAVGLPFLLFMCVAAGMLAGRSDRAGVWVGAWALSGALIGIAVGLMPYVGLNLATWIAEPRLWGTNVYPIGAAGAARMAFAAALNSCVGPAVGLAGHVLVKRSRGLASPAGRMSMRSWTALALCLPLAVLPALICDEVVNHPLRSGQRTVHRAISVGPTGDTSQGSMAPYRALLSAGYTLHRVGYDPETLERQTVDVAFDDGTVVRCQVSGQALNSCLPILPEFEAWMDALIKEGLTGGQETELVPHAGRVSVSEDTLQWLASERGVMGARYEISRDTQRGGQVVMSAHFDTGYVLTCYFRGASPVVLDHCSGNQ